MWLEYAEGNDLANSKPWYDHSDESRAMSVKYFFTESEHGFQLPVDMYERNRAVLKYFLFMEGIFVDTTVSEKEITDELRAINKCLEINPPKKDLIVFFSNEVIYELWFEESDNKPSYQNSK